MTRLGYVAHGAQPLEGFRGGSALRAIVVVAIIAIAIAGAVAKAIVVAGSGGGAGMGMGVRVRMRVGMGMRVRVGVGLAGQERNGRWRHRIAADGGEIVLRPMMRLSGEKIALLT